MLTNMGLRRKKSGLIRLAEPQDKEFNEIIQEAVKSLNRLLQSREDAVKNPQPVDKTGHQR